MITIDTFGKGLFEIVGSPHVYRRVSEDSRLGAADVLCNKPMTKTRFLG